MKKDLTCKDVNDCRTCPSTVCSDRAHPQDPICKGCTHETICCGSFGKDSCIKNN